MNNQQKNKARNTWLPYLFLSCAAGILTGLLIFCFKISANAVVALSSEIYEAVRENPALLPLLIAGASLVGLLAAFILRFEPDCRGGGIPTAIALLRGLITFRWLRSLLCLFPSAMLTYLVGVPLGNEGPSVQMGTAVGKGTVKLLAGKDRAWERYIMTGSACAGFAAATGAPLTGMFFAFEEAHRRFSPMIFMGSAMTVIAGTTVMRVLCTLFELPFSLFPITLTAELPMHYLWAPILVGAVCGIGAVGFTFLYRFMRKLIKVRLVKIPFTVKIVVIFSCVALIGFFFPNSVGSGHHLTENLLTGRQLWYPLMWVLVIRVLLLITANNADITGGLFVPTLAIGAILGSLCASALIALKLLPEQYYSLLVVIGIASFLGACSHTPLMAITFAIEALCGLSNILSVIAAVTFAYFAVEFSSQLPFTDAVIEGKTEQAHKGKRPRIVETSMSVMPSAFIIGKEIRDIFWPPACTVLFVQKANPQSGGNGIEEGDVIFLYFRTYDPDQTISDLEALLGEQSVDASARIRAALDNQEIPEL